VTASYCAEVELSFISGDSIWYVGAMGKTVTISDDLAALLEARQREAGYPSLDAAAEAFISHGLVANTADDDHSMNYTDNELGRLIDEAEASGPVVGWDAAAVKADVLRRYAARRRGRE
jgi:hypothetical protein